MLCIKDIIIIMLYWKCAKIRQLYLLRDSGMDVGDDSKGLQRPELTTLVGNKIKMNFESMIWFRPLIHNTSIRATGDTLA